MNKTTHKLVPRHLGMALALGLFTTSCGLGSASSETSFSNELKEVVSKDFSYNRGDPDMVEEFFATIKEDRQDVARLYEDYMAALQATDYQIAALMEDDDRIAAYFPDAEAHAESMDDSLQSKEWIASIAGSKADWAARHVARDRMVERLQEGKTMLVDEMQRLKLKLTLAYVLDLKQKDSHGMQPAKVALAQQADIRSQLRKLAP